MDELLAVITITLLAVISPGPDFALVSRNSLLRSRRAGALTALGIGLGVLVHVSYTLVGVGVLIQQSLWLFDAIRLAGAAYLILLGVKMLRSQPAGTQAEAPEAPLSDAAALRMGFFTNVLNPKTTVFIVSLFLQVVRPDTPLAVQVGWRLHCQRSRRLVRPGGAVLLFRRRAPALAGGAALGGPQFRRVAGGLRLLAGVVSPGVKVAASPQPATGLRHPQNPLQRCAPEALSSVRESAFEAAWSCTAPSRDAPAAKVGLCCLACPARAGIGCEPVHNGATPCASLQDTCTTCRTHRHGYRSA